MYAHEEKTIGQLCLSNGNLITENKCSLSEIRISVAYFVSSIRLSVYSILELCSTRYCRDAHL